MDEQTALVFALQLVALFSIAGALLVYLLCKIRATPEPEAGVATIGGGKSVIVTSCDTAVGLQVNYGLEEKFLLATRKYLRRFKNVSRISNDSESLMKNIELKYLK